MPDSPPSSMPESTTEAKSAGRSLSIGSAWLDVMTLSAMAAASSTSETSQYSRSRPCTAGDDKTNIPPAAATRPPTATAAVRQNAPVRGAEVLTRSMDPLSVAYQQVL